MIFLDVGGRGPGLVPPEAAALPVGDRGFLYGDGLFETMLARSGAVPLRAAHLRRLAASAAFLGIPCDGALVDRAVGLVAAQAGTGEWAIRLTLSRGAAERRGFAPPVDARPTLLVTAAPYRRPSGPLSAVTATVRVHPDSPLVGHKTLSALEKVLAQAEAARAGASEALLLNLEGRLAECASANLFIRRGARWITPPLSEGCLPGIMRERMIAAAGADEVPLTALDLFTADGVFVTNALLGCMALGTLDGKALPLCPEPAFAPALL